MHLSDMVTANEASLQHQIIVYPDYREGNPYQDLLYEGSDKAFSIELTLDWKSALNAATHPFIFHLHWEDRVYRMEEDIAAAHKEAQAFITALELFREKGGNIIWTIHNEAPHHGRFEEVQEALVKALKDLVDLVLVHHPSAMHVATNRFGFSNEKIAIVPHGHYRSMHEQLGAGRDRRRTRLGIKANERVLLLFGRLDSYKGAKRLIEAASRIDAPNLRLVIAGKVVDDLDSYVEDLPENIKNKLIYRPGFVQSKEVSELFDIADMVAAPYSAILTSATAMAALSVAKPVLAPDFPGLKEWLSDGENAILYSATNELGLEQAIRRFLALDQARLQALGACADQSSLRYPWEPTHQMLNGLYARFLLNRTPPRKTISLDWFRLD